MWMRIRVRSPSKRSCLVSSAMVAPFGSGNSFGDAHAEDHADQPADQAGEHVDRAVAPFTVLQHPYGFPAICRERGEPADEADGDANAPFRRKRKMQQRVFADAANQETADQIDDKRARRKRSANARLNHALQDITRQRAERSEYE